MSDHQEEPDKAAIRARIAAEEKKAAHETAANRSQWWKKLVQVKVPRFGRRAGYALMGAAALYGAAGELSGGVNNTLLEISTPDNGSAIVETFTQSMKRELDTGWCPSSSYAFSPSHIRFDMCGFQEGKQEVYIRLAQNLNDHLTRQGYATKIDADVSEILRAFNRGNHWSITPWSSTYDQYRGGIEKLKDLQKRQMESTADDSVMHYRIENLSYLVNSLASNIGSEQASLDDSTGWLGGIMGSRTDYYHALGVMSGTCEVMKAIGKDFSEVLYLQSSTDIFKQATDSACATTGWKPQIIFNGIQRPALLSEVAKVNVNLQTVQNALAAQGITNGNIARRPGVSPAAPARPGRPTTGAAPAVR